MKSPTILLLSVLPVLLLAPAIRAESVGVQFVSDRQAAGLDAAEVAGVSPYGQANWNFTNTAVNGDNSAIQGPESGTLVNSTGAATGVTVTWGGPNTWNTNNGIATPDSKLMNGYLDCTSTGNSTMTFANIPFTTYDVVVYFGSDGNGRTGSMHSSTANLLYSYTTASNQGGFDQTKYLRTTNTAPLGAGSPTANYCVFQGQTSATFSLDIIRGSNNSGYHAVQIVNRADFDGDGMPDAYEIAHGLNPNVDDAGLDPDGDGMTNLQEFQAGTDPQNPDTDGDGLKDGVETKTGIFVSATNTGSDPLKADTDGDGLTDGAEVNTHHTDPNKRDTDDDGYTDSYEITSGTNPLLASSNPGISSPGQIGLNFAGGYNGGTDLVIGTAGVVPQDNWNNASGNVGGPMTLNNQTGAATDATVSWSCANTWSVADPSVTTAIDEDAKLMNGYLDSTDVSTTTVTIENIPFRSYDVYLYLDGDSGDGTRAGDYTVNGVVRSNVVDAANWPVAAGGGVFVEIPPDNSTTGNYLVFHGITIGTINVTAHATTAALFRAPLNAIQIVSNPDTDGDGMPDAYENAHGLNPNNPADAAQDADGDGLTNLQEYTLGTDPQVPDTDGDGLGDGVETNTGIYVDPTHTGTNPLKVDTDGDGLSDGAELNGAIKTDPNKADTDGDGFLDKGEIDAGTNPNDPASPATDVGHMIGLSFNSDRGGAASELLPTDVAGFAGGVQTHWNNTDTAINGATANISSPTAGVVVDNSGAPTSVTASWTAGGTYNTTNGTATGDAKLMNGYIDNTGTGATILLDNIPYALYDVVVYFGSDGNSRTGSIYSASADLEYFYTTDSNITPFGKSYIETTSLVSTVTPPSNFCRYRNQSGPTFQAQVNHGDNNSGMHGVQIIDRTPPPGLAFTAVSRNPGTSVVTITWTSQAGKTYTVRRTADFINWTTVNSSVPSGGSTTTYSDTSIPAGTAQLFYRAIEN